MRLLWFYFILFYFFLLQILYIDIFVIVACIERSSWKLIRIIYYMQKFSFKMVNYLEELTRSQSYLYEKVSNFVTHFLLNHRKNFNQILTKNLIKARNELSAPSFYERIEVSFVHHRIIFLNAATKYKGSIVKTCIVQPILIFCIIPL